MSAQPGQYESNRKGEKIDNIFSYHFVNKVTTDKNEKLSYKGRTTRSSIKNGRRNRKWWNNELTELWQNCKEK